MNGVKSANGVNRHSPTEGGEGDQDSRRSGLVVVFTGNGKGKTTAALGSYLRAWGRDMKVGMFQFIKNTNANNGEHRAARKLGWELTPLGDGLTWLSKDIEASRGLAVQLWEICKQRINSGQYDLIILDEFTFPLHYGWVSVEGAIEVLRGRPQGLHIIITGRFAPQALIDYADLVTEMVEVKHPYHTRGLEAQPGIEF